MIVIVFEEIGGIFVIKNGELYCELIIDILREMLEKELVIIFKVIFFICW